MSAANLENPESKINSKQSGEKNFSQEKLQEIADNLINIAKQDGIELEEYLSPLQSSPANQEILKIMIILNMSELVEQMRESPTDFMELIVILKEQLTNPAMTELVKNMPTPNETEFTNNKHVNNSFFAFFNATNNNPLGHIS